MEDRDISDASVLADLLGAEAVEKTGDPEINQSLIQATDGAVNRGLFGAPTFLVGQEMFFGHDRMDLLEAFLQDRL